MEALLASPLVQLAVNLVALWIIVVLSSILLIVLFVMACLALEYFHSQITKIRKYLSKK